MLKQAKIENTASHRIEIMQKLDDIPNRPTTPVVIRFIGCDAEIVGVNQDFFTVGDAADCDVHFPPALFRDGQTVFRIGRAAEGWRLNCPSGANYYLNQEAATRPASLRSGDVIRLVPGGPGMQFNILNQNSEPLSKLAARYAPRLIQSTPDSTSTENESVSSVISISASRSPAKVIGALSQATESKKSRFTISPLAARWLDFKNWDKSAKLSLILILILLSIALVTSLWPAGESGPSENGRPFIAGPDESEK